MLFTINNELKDHTFKHPGLLQHGRSTITGGTQVSTILKSM